MKNYTREEKIRLLNYLGTLYRKECGIMDRNEVREDEIPYGESLVRDINHIVAGLTKQQAEIIRNDFLFVRDRNWWQNRYSPELYLRMKNITVDEFFRCLYA